MAYARSAVAPSDLSVTPKPTRSGRSVWRRFITALMDSRQRQADREIARFLASSGGKFTDETEREIERRILTDRTRW
jgi:hypothetical protein